jgi:hypothetical protein
MLLPVTLSLKLTNATLFFEDDMCLGFLFTCSFLAIQQGLLFTISSHVFHQEVQQDFPHGEGIVRSK